MRRFESSNGSAFVYQAPPGAIITVVIDLRSQLREKRARATGFVNGFKGLPVDVSHGGVSIAAVEKHVEAAQGSVGIEAAIADALEGTEMFLRGHPAASPGPPVDRQRRQPKPAPFERQRVEKGVRRRVVGTLLRPEDRRQRREHDEEVERQLARALVQPPGALDLGRENRPE